MAGLQACSLLISECSENPFATNLPQLRVKNQEEVTEEAVTTTLRRSLSFYSTIQAHDGHWAGDYGGPMFLLPGLVREKSSNHCVIQKMKIRRICISWLNMRNKF